MDLQPKGMGRRLQVSRLGLGKRIGRINESGNDGRRGHELVQHLQLLLGQLHAQRGHAGDVAARPIQAGDKANLDRVAPYRKDDRDRCGCGFGRDRRVYGPGRSDHGDLATHQIDRQLWQSIVLALRPVVYDRNIPAFDITSFAQALPEGGQTNNVRVL
jgi:hypothetical protein